MDPCSVVNDAAWSAQGPVDADEAIRRFTIAWGRPGPLGCSHLRCIR